MVQPPSDFETKRFLEAHQLDILIDDALNLFLSVSSLDISDWCCSNNLKKVFVDSFC